MKKFILYLILLLPGLMQQTAKVFAQNNIRWGLSAAINSVGAQLDDPQWDSWGYAKGNFQNVGDISNKSISLGIIPKYLIRNDILLRFEFSITSIRLTNHYDANPHLAINNSSYSPIINQSIKQKVYRFIPGIQWNFVKKKFIESYCGMTASYQHYSRMKYENVTETWNLQTNTITDGIKDNATATGGFATGVGAFAGFNVYFCKRFSFGAETSFSLLYYKIGNTFSGTSISLNNPTAVQVYSYSNSSYKGLQFTRILPSFNISARF